MAGPTILLDDGGVMNDNRLRAPQWQRLVGEFFSPLLGGTLEQWAEANRVVAARLFDLDAWLPRVRDAADYSDFQRRYWLDWLGGMCDLMGIATPAEPDCLDLSRRAEDYITPRVRAAFPGAGEAIRQLHREGYRLHTASSGSSSWLAGTLEGMGVRDCFDRLYGPDLIDTFKGEPDYYERIFADLDLHPSDALVVDDSPIVLACAAEVGAQTALISPATDPTPAPMYIIASLAELPELVRGLG